MATEQDGGHISTAATGMPGSKTKLHPAGTAGSCAEDFASWSSSALSYRQA